MQHAHLAALCVPPVRHRQHNARQVSTSCAWVGTRSKLQEHRRMLSKATSLETEAAWLDLPKPSKHSRLGSNGTSHVPSWCITHLPGKLQATPGVKMKRPESPCWGEEVALRLGGSVSMNQEF